MSNLNTGRIAKNTLMLYVRMFILMGVSLYTSRVILSVLGVDDYGIYTLIGGVISIFAFVTNALVGTMQRFFNVALGEEDPRRFNGIYIMGNNIFIIVSLFFFLVGETLGIWYMDNYIVLPPGREQAAFWVFQLSLMTMVLQLFRICDHAAIIAYEKMSFYAVLSLVEAFLKLVIVFSLQWFESDKLILYAVLYLLTVCLINLCYKFYTRIQFTTCRYRLEWDSVLFKQLFSFSGWSLLSNGSSTITLQLENVFLNRFFPLSVNAARGLATQVYNAVNMFVVNFQTAFNPQLTQSYVSGQKDDYRLLLFRSSKYSFFLMWMLFVPIVFNLEELLSIWLVSVPLYTREFCLFVLIAYLADSLASPLWTTLAAQGAIRQIQICTSVVFWIQLVVSYFSLSQGYSPYLLSVYIMISRFINYLLHMVYTRKLCQLNVGEYSKTVLLPLLVVVLVSLPIPLFLHFLLPQSIWYIRLVVDTVWGLSIIWMMGMKRDERAFFWGMLKNRFA
ncbi:MAG: lipopolysaccharide biosynthesis protein [Bacteroidales bacterium]|nr:lipopolysaccharide biosynthesis protein [Bacteroidales bacterium]